MATRCAFIATASLSMATVGYILARSEVRSHLEAALRIATGAVTVSSSQPIKDAGAVLLGKLSNRQAINLASSRELLTPDLDSRLGISLRLFTGHDDPAQHQVA
jgi:hypothetical protein